jgi:hypothetical protein
MVQRKKSSAIRKLVTDALLLKRRQGLAMKFMTCEWRVELKGFEVAQAADQRADNHGNKRWRD